MGERAPQLRSTRAQAGRLRIGRCRSRGAFACALGVIGAMSGLCSAQTGTHIGPQVPVDEAPAAPVVVSAPAASTSVSSPSSFESQPLKPLKPKAAAPADAASPGGANESKSSDLWNTWVKPLSALVLVLCIIAVLARLARGVSMKHGGLLAAIGAGGRAPSGVLSVLARYPVGRGQTLVLLHLHGRVLLVCQTQSRSGGGMQTLSEITDPEQIAMLVGKTREHPRTSMNQDFGAELARSEERTDRELAAAFGGVQHRAFSAREARPKSIGPAPAPVPAPSARRSAVASPRLVPDADENTNGAMAAAAIRRRLSAMHAGRPAPVTPVPTSPAEVAHSMGPARTSGLPRGGRLA
jgi:flagellar biogenesis protein FliO